MPQTPLTPEQVHSRLIQILPDFAAYWDSPDNLFREDNGSLTLWGVFAECSHFVRDRYEKLSKDQLCQLGRFVNECMALTDTDLDNAVATCLLENLSFERFSKDFEQYLGGEALNFYRQFQGA